MDGDRIVVVGSANVDYVVSVPMLPRPGETVLAHRLTVHEGGKGANQAVAAARAGGVVHFIGSIGRDPDGERLRASLAKAGVSTDRVEVSDHASGVALISVDERGQNTIAVVPGANARLLPEHVERFLAIPDAKTLLVQLEVPLAAVTRAVQIGARRGMLVVLNPAPAAKLDRDLLELVDVLTPNESEAEVLTGVPVRDGDGAAAVAERLLQLGPRVVVVTLGSQGAFVASREGLRMQLPAFPAEAIDTTAAGDVFNGALAVALTEAQPLVDAVRFACAAAAISVTREGAQSSAPLRPEIESMLRQGAAP